MIPTKKTDASEADHRLQTVTISASADGRKIVRTCEGTLSAVLESVTSATQALHSLPLTVTVHTGGCIVPARTELAFTNIVGKIKHYDCCQTLRPEVKDLAQDIYDGFGGFWCISSPHCNLRASKACTITLFRGGRDTSRISHVINHAVLPETIKSVTIHMMVISTRLGHAVAQNCVLLMQQMQASTSWQAYSTYDEGDMTNFKGIILHKFTKDFLQQFDMPVDPSKVRLNIARTGTMNMFLSLKQPLLLDTGVELRYLPFLKALENIVFEYT